MMIAPVTATESKRLASLKSYDIMDSLPEQDYDDITSLAAEICQTSISLISFIDDHRQWFKSNHGIEVKETPKDFAFCSHAIINPHEVLQVSDLRKDKRFAGNPLVTGDPHVVFYAGAPLINEAGFPMGSLCIVDHQPKTLTDKQLNGLRILAKQVVNLLESRKRNKVLSTLKQYLEERNEELEKIQSKITKELKPAFHSLDELIALLNHTLNSGDIAAGEKMLEKAGSIISNAKQALNDLDSDI